MGDIFAKAYKIREMQQQQTEQNAMKAFFANPDNLDPTTHAPKETALNDLIRVAPNMGMQLADQAARLEHERALKSEDVLKQQIQKDNLIQNVIRIPAMNAYNKAIADGKTPEQAKLIGQDVMDKGSQELGGGGDFSEAERAQWPKDFDPERIGARMKINQAHNAKKSGDVETLTDSKGNTFDHDKLTGENTFVSGPDGDPGKPYNPEGGVQKIGGGGQARSGTAAIVQAYLRQHPDAGPDDIAEVIAQAKRTEVTGTADVQAGAASLKNIEKTRGMVQASEGNANKEADLVLSLVDKGGGSLPRFFNKPLQDFKVQALGNTDAAALRVATESFKNEYVKVLSTQSGVSGGQSSDSARKEADSFINDGLSIEQIKRNIEIMRKSMQTRAASLNEAYETESNRVQSGKRGPDTGGGKWPAAAASYLRSHPNLKAQFDAKYGAGSAAQVLGD